jgi:hypothetical protein
VSSALLDRVPWYHQQRHAGNTWPGEVRCRAGGVSD